MAYRPFGGDRVGQGVTGDEGGLLSQIGPTGPFCGVEELGATWTSEACGLAVQANPLGDFARRTPTI